MSGEITDGLKFEFNFRKILDPLCISRLMLKYEKNR